MSKKTIIPILTVLSFAFVFLAQAQQSKVYRVGVILEGGGFYAVVDGLKDGPRTLAFEEGKHFQLEIRDLRAIGIRRWPRTQPGVWNDRKSI